MSSCCWFSLGLRVHIHYPKKVVGRVYRKEVWALWCSKSWWCRLSCHGNQQYGSGYANLSHATVTLLDFSVFLAHLRHQCHGLRVDQLGVWSLSWTWIDLSSHRSQSLSWSQNPSYTRFRVRDDAMKDAMSMPWCRLALPKPRWTTLGTPRHQGLFKQRKFALFVQNLLLQSNLQWSTRFHYLVCQLSRIAR